MHLYLSCKFRTANYVKTLELNNLYIMRGLQFSHRMCVLLKVGLSVRPYHNNVYVCPYNP